MEWDQLSGSHGSIGTREDIHFHLAFVADLKQAVADAIAANPFTDFVDPNAPAHTRFLATWFPHIARVVFNDKGQHIRREWLLLDLKQRIRDVREGPDGYMYVVTDAATKGAILRIEPAD